MSIGHALRRTVTSRAAVRPVSYVVAVGASFLLTGALIAVLGYDPVSAFRAIVTTSFKSSFGLTETIHKWVPITLLGLAFAIPFLSRKFNIGGEGQLLIGATAAAAVGILLADLPMAALLPMLLAAGAVAGGLWAGIAAWLMNRFGVNEILSTVLLNFASFGVVDYIASEVWSDPAAGHPTTIPVGGGGLLPRVGNPPLHAGVLLCLVAVIAVIVVVRRTPTGYELRAVGDNARAARVHGVRTGRVAAGALVVGGVLAGFAGAIEVAGIHGKLIEGMQSNFLLLGIIVALIARGSVVALPFVAFGIAVLEVGANAMQRAADVPVEMVLIAEALILIFVLLSTVVEKRVGRT